MLKKICNYIKDNEFRFTVFNDKIHIINYDELVNLSNDIVFIRVGNKKIKIIGDNLILSKLLECEVLIYGVVHNIEVIDG